MLQCLLSELFALNGFGFAISLIIYYFESFIQVCNSSQPVHPLMMSLLETYVQATVTSINISKTTKHQRMNSLHPFNEDEILPIFQEGGAVECYDRTTSQILLMMYCLLYQNALLENMKTLGKEKNCRL